MATSALSVDKSETTVAGDGPDSSPPRSVQTPPSDASPAQDKRETVTRVQIILILVPVTLVYFLVMLDNSIIATGIPSITSEFNSLLDVGWYGSAYQLASSAFQPMSGKIYTHFSTKWSFLSFFVLFEIGSAICGAAQSSVMLIVGRAIAGLGSAGILNGALTIISCILSPHSQAMAMGINVGLGQIGVATGPLIGGAFTENVSWRWCFYINLPIGAVVIGLLLFTHIPEVRPKQPVRVVLGSFFQLFDMVGFVLIAPCSIMLLLALHYGGNEHAWNSSVIIGLFVGSGLTCITFLVWEYKKGEDAMVPFSMLRQRIVWCASFAMFFISGVLYCGNYFLPIYFQAVKNDSAIMSGVHTLPTAVGQAVFAMLAGTLIHALGYYLPWVLVGTALSSIGYGLLSGLTPSTPVAKWVGYQILYGVGIGSAFSTSFIAIQSVIPAPQIPVAMAIVIFTQYLGGATCLTTAQTIFSNVLRSEVKKNAPSVDAEIIVHAGARSIRQLVSSAELPGVLKAYSTAVGHVMYLGAGISVAAFAFGAGLGWKDIRKGHTKPAQSESDGAVASEKTEKTED